MKHWLIPFLAMAQIALPLPSRGDTPPEGVAVADSFLSGDAAAVWSGSTPALRDVFGSAEAIDALRETLRRDFGSEEEVLSERVETRDGHEIYTRVSRWSASPAAIELVVTTDQQGRIAGFLVRPQPVAAPSTRFDYRTRAELRLPVEGAWHVVWGGRDIETNYHAVDPGQRFAIDLLVYRDGQTHAGDPSRPENYHCWGMPVSAPADGTVVRAVGNLPDQAIGSTDPENPVGNHVVIDFGSDEYGFLAHLQRGSLRVSEGESVAQGQEIGLCGNSGNTTEPHLHFHMQTGPVLGQGEGLPAQFQNYRADGVVVERGEPTKGQTIEKAG